MHLPNRPTRGTPIQADWGDAVIDYLKALTAQDSPTIKATMTTGGTTLAARKSAGGGGALENLHPFKCLITSGLKFKISPGIAGNQSFSQVPSNLNAEFTAAANNSEGFWAWVRLEFDGPTLTDCFYQVGATVPNNPAPTDDLPAFYHFPLFFVTTTATSIDFVAQMWVNSIFFSVSTRDINCTTKQLQLVFGKGA